MMMGDKSNDVADPETGVTRESATASSHTSSIYPLVAAGTQNASNRKASGGLKKTASATRGSLVHQLTSMRKYPTILIASLLIFGALTTVGLVFCKNAFDKNAQEASEHAIAVSQESGNKLSSVLDLAIVPLFSMAQFATELEIFRELPEKIGQAYESGSLPFIVNADGSPSTSFRNITGVCDDPVLERRYSKIVETIQKNLGMEDILQNMQLVSTSLV